MTKHIDLDDDIVKKNWESGEAWLNCNRETIREGMKQMVQRKIELGVSFGFTPGEVADEVWSFLHSQGVVVKVDRELCPSPYIDNCPEDIGFNHCRNIHIAASYVPVVSLIEVTNNDN